GSATEIGRLNSQDGTLAVHGRTASMTSNATTVPVPSTRAKNVVNCAPGDSVVFNNVALERATGGAVSRGAGVVLRPVGVTNNTWLFTISPQNHDTGAVKDDGLMSSVSSIGPVVVTTGGVGC